MRYPTLCRFCLALFAACLAWPVAVLRAAAPAGADIAAALSAVAPRADPDVIELATRALSCAHSAQLGNAATLSVIDYTRPSTQPRLWVFDLARRQLLFEELVAHGRNTGNNVALRFSNAPGSLMSSIGVFMTAEPYRGHNGYSLRLRGLEPGFNDNALDRDVVIHGAAYVDPGVAGTLGRLGRSFGCPAVRPAIAHQLIDAIQGGSLLVAYYPDESWLRGSSFVGGCDKTAMNGTGRDSVFDIARTEATRSN